MAVARRRAAASWRVRSSTDSRSCAGAGAADIVAVWSISTVSQDLKDEHRGARVDAGRGPPLVRNKNPKIMPNGQWCHAPAHCKNGGVHSKRPQSFPKVSENAR